MTEIFKKAMGSLVKRLGMRKIGVLMVILIVAAFWYWKSSSGKPQATSFQTAQAEKGTLVVAVAASGNVVGGNNAPITTSATGVVSNVYVKNGDRVVQGQKIAEVALDGDGLQRQASAWSSYLSARNQLASTQANVNTLQAAEFKANQTFINDAVARGLVTSDPTYIQEYASWLAAEANYTNQAGVVAQAQAAVSSAWYSYQQSSSTVLAPTSGIVGDIAIAPGVPLAQSSTSSTNSSASQKVGTVNAPDGKVVVTVDVAEVDSPKVSAGQRATLTLDAFPNQTFTGKVLTVDTSGQVSSGVTTYPATIALDNSNGKIYPNMAVDAKIITEVKDNVVLVPSGAVQASSGQSTVRILRNGGVTIVPVGVGDSNDTQTEVTSGLKGGETVVTGTTGATSSSQGQGGGSPFGAFGGGRGFGGGGGAVRLRGD